MIRAIILSLAILAANAAQPNLPKRPPDAVTGSAFIEQISSLDLAAREIEIKKEALKGNVPEFWRHFVPIRVNRHGRTAEYFVAPDYFCIGSDEDYFLTPMRPETAQAIADAFGCMLPTPKMVDDIYAAAVVKLKPSPIPASTNMTKVSVFGEHNKTVETQRSGKTTDLVAGHKKDVVITSRLVDAPGKVAIYGWHRVDGSPIQPLYLGHTATWVDYSHGIRFVLRDMTVDGEPTTVDAVLADTKLSALLSDEGPIVRPRYPLSIFGERNLEVHFEPGVRAVINYPRNFETNRPTRLILYALPNGNTIEQSIGRKPRPGDDRRFNIQHIGAQTRWVRERLTNENIVIAYLECAEKSWPAWRRKHDSENTRIPKMVEDLRLRFPINNTRITLTGHSGGGSFTFGFIDETKEIPPWVDRFAFLDSNYAYDKAKGHDEKILKWLHSAPDHYLCVLAYHDSIALLDGKGFVSERGGTWGRSHAMVADFNQLSLKAELDDEWERYRALNNRVQFLLKRNPTKAILHTVQVERNGFIHAILSGTAAEEKEYKYFGERVYNELIDEN
jgi:hypothetical protein